jgi:hypothetical protein
MSASPAIRHTTTAAVAAVGLIAAVVSYSHMQQLGYHHGESWRSYLIPISIDGLMAAASMVLLTRRRSGLPASPLAWVALVLGGIASLSANMADAQPNATAILYAGWAPLGFLLAFELLLQQRRAEGSEETQQSTDGAALTTEDLAEIEAATDHSCDPAVWVARDPAPTPIPTSPEPIETALSPGGLTDEALTRAIQEWAAQEGSVPSREKIRQRYRVGTKRAERVRSVVLILSTDRGQTSPMTPSSDPRPTLHAVAAGSR